MTLKCFIPLVLLTIVNISTEYGNWKPYRSKQLNIYINIPPPPLH